ncbi:MAG: zinc-ribbon domain-containing protein [Roseburia sp.]|nr:zinc-ribbon domain-containing protein [Roseburia sp.]
MFCNKCGQEIKPGAKFCTKCGTPVPQVQQPAPEQPAKPKKAQPAPEQPAKPKKAQSAPKQSVTPEQEPPKKNKKPVFVILVIILVILLFVCGGLVGYYITQIRGNDDTVVSDDNDKDKDTESLSRESGKKSKKDSETEEATEAVSKKGAHATVDGTEESEVKETNKEHTYQIVVADVTWTQAYQQAKEVPNGHLATFETQEEMDKVIQQINAEGHNDMIFWIGMTRRGDSTDYQWVDENGKSEGKMENSNSNWLQGEPSFYDTDNSKDEYYVDMFYSSSNSRWVWNDVPDDLLALIPSYSGKVGYIVEIEE